MHTFSISFTIQKGQNSFYLGQNWSYLDVLRLLTLKIRLQERLRIIFKVRTPARLGNKAPCRLFPYLPEWGSVTKSYQLPLSLNYFLLHFLKLCWVQQDLTIIDIGWPAIIGTPFPWSENYNDQCASIPRQSDSLTINYWIRLNIVSFANR
jgi:hypothetical protein